MVGMQNIVWCGVVGSVIMQVWACALLCFAILYDCNQETLLAEGGVGLSSGLEFD